MCELERDVSELDSLRTQLAKANERVKRLEKICKGLCKPIDSKPNNRAFDDWIEYTEQLRKEQNK